MQTSHRRTLPYIAQPVALKLQSSFMLSVFDIFRVGIGPSSSHTVGPMRAALRFAQRLESEAYFIRVARIEVVLYGSLGATGRGHATDHGVVLGLLGEEPQSVQPHVAKTLLEVVQRERRLELLGRHCIEFDSCCVLITSSPSIPMRCA
jgi:L-serine dehydratase